MEKYPVGIIQIDTVIKLQIHSTKIPKFKHNLLPNSILVLQSLLQKFQKLHRIGSDCSNANTVDVAS